MKGLLLTGKPFIFAVGADLGAFTEVTSAEQGRQGSEAGQQAFRRLAGLPLPTLAAINNRASPSTGAGPRSVPRSSR